MSKNYKGNITTKEIVNEVKIAKSIILTVHINPDGDALGSVLAFYFIKQCKNTRNFSREMNCTKILVSIQGNLYVDTEQNRATKKLNCWELLKLV